jgi:PAS domain S-box-containing protein
MPASNRVSRLNQVEWLLLIVALMLAGLGFVYVHQDETQRIGAAESNRSQALTMVLGNDVASNLDAANLTLQGAIGYTQSGIAHGDGIKFLNFPVKAGIDGANVDHLGSLFRRHRDGGQAGSVLAGTIRLTSEQRLAASQTIQPAALAMDKPLVIMLSGDLAAIKQPLLREATTYAMFYGALVLLCCTGLYWMQNRRSQVAALSAGRERDRLQADARLTLALRGANLGLWNYDVAGAALKLDGNSLAIVGHAPEGGNAALWHDSIHPDDLSSYGAARDACIDGSVPVYEVTFRILHREGHWIWILARGQAIAHDQQGVASALMGTHLDLTDIKNAEQEVARSNNELQIIFDNLTEAVFVIGSTGNLIHINRAARSIHAMFDPDTPRSQVMEGIEVILPDGELLEHAQWPSQRGLRGDFVAHMELEIRRKDNGATIFIECSTAPIRMEAGAVGVFVVTFRDVTERRLAHALRDSEARLRTLIEDAPLAIAMLRAGHIIYANPRYHALHGYLASDDLTGLPWRTMLSPESCALLQTQQASIAADSPLELRFEAEGLGKDGRLVPLFKTTARALLADGAATLVFVQDISAQKVAEAAMLQALDGAEKASRSKAEFLANMSHEIRSPLNAMLGLAYLLEQARMDGAAHDMVRKIRASGRMLLGIINDILDVSKIEAGHMTIEQAPFRLRDVIDHLAVAMNMAAVEKHIELIIDALPQGVDLVIGDALRLEQVLLNLTSNAIKFTEVGLVNLRIELLSRSEESLVLRFCVQDTGIGIAAALQEEVFSAFAQADTSTTRRFGGSGLGLTICRQLVTLMHGEIGVASTPGQGSLFWFTLTLSAAVDVDFSGSDTHGIDVLPALLPAPRRRAVHDLAGVRLLIVDDSEINREVAQRILCGAGALVTLAVDGKDALDWLLDHPDQIDLILMDVQMPVMDGIEATRQLRRLPQFQAMPIVALTAGALTSQQDAARAAGMNDFISKPFDVAKTIALILRLVSPLAPLAPEAGIGFVNPVANPIASTAAKPVATVAVVMDVGRALQLWSDLPAYRDYLRRFAASYGDAVDVMLASLAGGDRMVAAALAHKLAGAAGNLALLETYRLAHEAERVLATGTDPMLTLEQLRQALSQAMVEIGTFAAPAADPAAPPSDPAPPADLAALFANVMVALDGDNPGPVEPLLAILAQHVAPTQLAPLVACVRGFDFRGAEVAVRALANATKV